MFKKMTLFVIFILIVTTLGCNKRHTATTKPPVAVDLATASSSELIEGIYVTGNLEPKFSVDVKTQIPGLVKDVYVTQWVSVRKGQPLARIDLSETEAIKKRAEAAVLAGKAQLAQAQVTLKRAEREESRILKLKNVGLATQQAVDDSHTETEAAKARVEAAKAQILVYQEELQQSVARVAKGLVVSPLNGVIALRDVNIGDLASDAAAGKPIFRVVDNRVLNLTVTVPSVDSAKVKVDQPLEFSVDALPGKTFSGRVMFINPELNAVDRSLKVVAEFRLEERTNEVAQEAHVKISSIRGQLPKDVEEPIIQKLDFNASPSAAVAIQSTVLNQRDLTTLVDKKIRKRFESVSGVGKVELVGGAKREVNVEVDPIRLDSLGLGVNDLVNGLKKENINTPLGRISRAGAEYPIRIEGKPDRTKDYRGMVIAARNNRPIALGEVATVTDGVEERRKLALVNDTR